MQRVIKENPLRWLWQPRAIARIGAPLLLIVIIALGDKYLADTFRAPANGHRFDWYNEIHYVLVLIAALLGVYTVRVFTRMLSLALEDHLGIGRAHSVAALVSVVLYAIVILFVIGGLGNLSGLLVGGALTGVILGIAGQASLSNIIAGLVILFARPYAAGMYLTARAGSFGGVEYSGQVWDVTLFYTILHSGGQEIRIPNSAMIAAVVVTRPQALDVYIPVTLPSTVDLPVILEEMRRAVASATAARRAPQVTLEGVTDTGYSAGIRVFVAGETERRAVERAVAGVVRRTAAPPDATTPATPAAAPPVTTAAAAPATAAESTAAARQSAP